MQSKTGKVIDYTSPLDRFKSTYTSAASPLFAPAPSFIPPKSPTIHMLLCTGTMHACLMIGNWCFLVLTVLVWEIIYHLDVFAKKAWKGHTDLATKARPPEARSRLVQQKVQRNIMFPFNNTCIRTGEFFQDTCYLFYHNKINCRFTQSNLWQSLKLLFMVSI